MNETSIQKVFPNAAQIDALNEIMQTIAGKIGVAATVRIVRIDTLSPGEPATVTEAPGSTESERQYILGIPEGQPGTPGDAGAAAGFGTVLANATVLEADQQPTVEAQLSGPNTAKNITFSFGIPKGHDGDPGTSAGFGTITATATKLNSDAQPTVQAEWGGPDTAKNLTLAFGIPAGQPGPAYTLTEQDKLTIVRDVLEALPSAEGVTF